ncbi:MAG: hypothetical protein KC441_17210 [Anaerolineales bacterium]|nr:hypothetical protein [Anaerolineales bacterium]
MGEREPVKEIIARGDLFFLSHPGAEEVFSGYGLTLTPGNKELLVGVLMVDRPQPAAPAWLQAVAARFGEYDLIPMTASGERGLICQMQIMPQSVDYLRPSADPKAAAIQTALQPLLENPPRPKLTLQWHELDRTWRSQLAQPNELPSAIRQTFEQTGYGCLATETNVGIVHVCHAPDVDIEGFRGQPVVYQWQLIAMPTAPLIRLEMAVLDDPLNPFRFESFLNSADPDQAKVLAGLSQQAQLQMAFYGDDLAYHFTKVVAHESQQQQQLAEVIQRAARYWTTLPPESHDFDQAKADFMCQTR